MSCRTIFAADLYLRGCHNLFHLFSAGRTSNSGYDVLADVPSEGEEGDDKIFFDLSDTPHLPAFHLCLDKHKGSVATFTESAELLFK